MGRGVKTISFLIREERIYLHANRDGKFKLPVVQTIKGHAKKIEKYFWPRDVVEHRVIKNLDPFLTLENGEKMRVYQGGDSTYMLTEVQSILDNHTEKSRNLRKKLMLAMDKMSGQYLFPWDDYDSDEIF